jgi:hypothetical protein
MLQIDDQEMERRKASVKTPSTASRTVQIRGNGAPANAKSPWRARSSPNPQRLRRQNGANAVFPEP